MSARLKNSKGQALDRPFAPGILAKARQIVAGYEIVIAFEDGQWYGHGLELPGARGDGKTPRAAVADTREAMIGVVAYMLEQGQRPPEPAREGNRSVQINIRVTPEEKAVLESRSRSKGFRGLSDFIRSSVLAEK